MINPDVSLSVIVPAYNAEEELPRCLRALNESAVQPVELIVVDDGSTDRTADIAVGHGARLLRSARRQSGPGAARNLAAEAAVGNVLVFVDADVVVKQESLGLVQENFEVDPQLTAVFGSYDAEPGASNFLSQYKNLQHHYVHQSGSPAAKTFWAGFGAIKKDIFLEMGGFDASRYSVPSIEDIELGYRLHDRGYRIKLDRNMQVCHLKRWRFWRLVHTEIFCRALPWSKLILARQSIPNDLNTRSKDRLSGALAWVLAVSLVLAAWNTSMIAPALAALAMLVWLNRDFYGFLLRHRGFGFVVRSVPMHVLYFLYSSLSFAKTWIWHLAGAHR